MLLDPTTRSGHLIACALRGPDNSTDYTITMLAKALTAGVIRYLIAPDRTLTLQHGIIFGPAPTIYTHMGMIVVKPEDAIAFVQRCPDLASAALKNLESHYIRHFAEALEQLCESSVNPDTYHRAVDYSIVLHRLPR